MALHNDDWLVADSEDEGTSTQLPLISGTGASAIVATHAPVTSPDTSAIQTLDTPQRGCSSILTDESLFTPPQPSSPRRGMDSTIGDFTSVPSTSGAPSAVVPKPRPRPRVVMKKATNSACNANVLGTSSSGITDPRISVTRQTDDSVHPATATSFGLSEIVDDAYSFGIAERAKMRSRKSQTAKERIQSQDSMNQVIELTSDEDELTLGPTKRQKKQGSPVPKLKAPTKSRPKPTLKVKPASVLPSDSPSSGIVIGGVLAQRAQRASSAQPLTPTLPTMPPSTPSQARTPTPPSPCLVTTTRKRKRMRPFIADEEEEMDGVSDSLAGDSSSLAMPPRFFASSSSSVPSDSGVEILPNQQLSGRGQIKQASSGKKASQSKARSKGKKGKVADITCASDEMVEESTRINQRPLSLAPYDGSSVPNEHHSPMVRNPTVGKKASRKQAGAKKREARVIDSSEEENDPVLSPKLNAAHMPPPQGSRENLRSDDPGPPKPEPSSTSGPQFRDSSIKSKLTPMSELIRRVNSQPCSPFPNATRTYSPLLKSSRTMLSRIAPLHLHRRTPPPPLPRPPPPKKSKKQLEMEEKIEEELAETIEGWSCFTDEERKTLRKARIDTELGYE